MGKKSKNSIPVHTPKSKADFERVHNELTRRGLVAIDVLRRGHVGAVSLKPGDGAAQGAEMQAACMGAGSWSNGPLSQVAWSFDGRQDTVEQVTGSDNKPLGLGYVKWGPKDEIPSVIPPLAQSNPYIASPLKYKADLMCGLGPHLAYPLVTVKEDESIVTKFVEYADAGIVLRRRIRRLEQQRQEQDGGETEGLQVYTVMERKAAEGEQFDDRSYLADDLEEARRDYDEWKRSWEGEDILDNPEERDVEMRSYTHRPGAREFLQENNLNLLMSQWAQDHVMLEMTFPTFGLEQGRPGSWDPKIVEVSFLPAHSCRLERMGEGRHINHVYFSDRFRRKGATGGTVLINDPENLKVTMYAACMPQHLIRDMRYIVANNQRKSPKRRPTWIVCPTFYPSLNKPYYPQPAWWSIFTSKAFDFSATILYDKYKARENNTSWGRILYLDLDYLDSVFGDEGYRGDPEKQQEFIDQLDQDMENFLQHRDNNGKFMRQFKWSGQDGKEHYNVEIVNVAEAINNEIKAGKEELELSTSPIFLALGIDPRLVGVPMVNASNGGTALREMHLMKQQQLNVDQRIFLEWLNTVPTWNKWHNARFIVRQQTFTTLDNSKSGSVETVAGEGA